MHLEGTLEPHLVIELSQKNDIKEFQSLNAEDVRKLMGEARDLPTFIKVSNKIEN